MPSGKLGHTSQTEIGAQTLFEKGSDLQMRVIRYLEEILEIADNPEIILEKRYQM